MCFTFGRHESLRSSGNAVYDVKNMIKVIVLTVPLVFLDPL